MEWKQPKTKERPAVVVSGPPKRYRCNSPMCKGKERNFYLDHETGMGFPVLVCSTCGQQKATR